MTLSFWALAIYSYAGLRLLDLITFVFPLTILSAYQEKGLSFDIIISIAFFAAGILSVAAFYRSILIEFPGPTPFLPYKTFLTLF